MIFRKRSWCYFLTIQFNFTAAAQNLCSRHNVNTFNSRHHNKRLFLIFFNIFNIRTLNKSLYANIFFVYWLVMRPFSNILFVDLRATSKSVKIVNIKYSRAIKLVIERLFSISSGIKSQKSAKNSPRHGGSDV